MKEFRLKFSQSLSIWLFSTPSLLFWPTFIDWLALWEHLYYFITLLLISLLKHNWIDYNLLQIFNLQHKASPIIDKTFEGFILAKKVGLNWHYILNFHCGIFFILVFVSYYLTSLQYYAKCPISQIEVFVRNKIILSIIQRFLFLNEGC